MWRALTLLHIWEAFQVKREIVKYFQIDDRNSSCWHKWMSFFFSCHLCPSFALCHRRCRAASTTNMDFDVATFLTDAVGKGILMNGQLLSDFIWRLRMGKKERVASEKYCAKWEIKNHVGALTTVSVWLCMLALLRWNGIEIPRRRRARLLYMRSRMCATHCTSTKRSEPKTRRKKKKQKEYFWFTAADVCTV